VTTLRPLASFALALLSVATIALSSACAQQPPGAAPPLPAEQQARLDALRAQGARAPLAVLPALVAGQLSKEVGDAVGLVVEQQAGLDGVMPANGSFAPPAGTPPEAIAALLQEHVRRDPPGSGHALFASFEARDRAFVAVRAWIVDHDGALVWSDVQQPGDAAFDRLRPDEPMECCVLVAERVRDGVGLARSRSPRADGFMAKWWAAKSSMPSKEEQEAMAPRAAALRKLGKSARVAVYPVRVAGAADAAQGASLAKALADRCAARAVDASIVVESKTTSNEQLLLWTTAKAFRAQLAASPAADADYALLAEYVTSPDRAHVGAVHLVLCTAKGEWVAVDWQNDHHDDFRELAPKGLPGCDELVARRLSRLMR